MPARTHRTWGAAAPLLAALALAACGPQASATVTVDAGQDGNMPNEGAAVGSSCDDPLDCDSPTTPACLTELKPMSNLAGVPAEIANLGLEFPTGYCSSVLNCVDDASCGDMGRCYRPFRAVTAATLRELEPPLGVSAGTLDFLPAYGVCLRACPNGAAACEVGQVCQKPLADFVSLVPGSINDIDFCVPDPSCPDTGCTAGPCSPNPCMNGGTCAVDGTSYACTCAGGFTGTNCEIPAAGRVRAIGEACTSDAQCDVRGTPRCLSELHPLEEALPPDEFLSQVGLDFDRGYCSNEPVCLSDVSCGPAGKCLAPFRAVTEPTLRDLERTFDPPLAAGALDFLGGYGVCLRACDDSFDCFSDQACDHVMAEFISQVPGSVNDKTFCVPHEDCRYCNSNAHCEVTGENGACVCNPGYRGNGLVCSPTGTGACADSPCRNGGTCTDGDGNAYTCACPTGYSGTNCQISAVCTPNPCRNGGTCSATGASTFECDCTDGYSGPTCEVVSLCPTLSAPSHGNVSVTSNGPGGVAQYECDTGYRLDGGNETRTCGANGAWTGSAPTCVERIDPCSPSPCQHGGVCTPGSGSSYTCGCAGTGYSGPTCSTPVDCGALGSLANGTITTAPSSSTTFGTTATYRCNSGYVLDGSATRTCQASATWSGTAPTCRAQVTPCDPNPCLNGGSCSVNGSSFTCQCQPGYSGNTCQTPFDCGALSPPANGTVTAASTTLGATASYACNPGYTRNGAASRTCQPTGWSGSAPTCTPSSCGTHTDVVYRLTGTFEILGTTWGIGDQTFTGLTSNATTPPFQNNTNTTPFTGGGTFARGFARLRFTNNGSGQPIAGSVRLVEFYMPLEFHQTRGADLLANNDHSLGLIANPGSLTNCGGGNTACASHTPTVNRTCAPNASGTLSGTTLTWGTCTPAWTGANSWSYASSARSATGAGCATGYVQYGNNTTDSGLVPPSGKGDLYQVYNQQLANITFSGTSYTTASWTMAKIQIPNGTGQSNTWLTITGATPVGTDCGTTVGVDLVCNQQ